MKTQRRSPRSALRLSAMEATRWCRLGFQVEDNSQDQRGAEQISQIDDAADCTGSLDLTCMKCDKRVSVTEHLHNLSPFSLHNMIEVFAKAWHATLGSGPRYMICVTPFCTLREVEPLFKPISPALNLISSHRLILMS